MNVMKKIVCGIALAGIAVFPATAGEHGGHHRHHEGNNGVRLAAEIVGLVRNALAPVPTVLRHDPPPEPPRRREIGHPAPHRERRGAHHEFRTPEPRHAIRR